MHTYVYCSTAQNSKDLGPTQMPINDGLDKENVTRIHHGTLCSHWKGCIHVLCRDMDKTGNHHSQQTDTRTENQILHVLAHRQVLNNKNTWTQGGEHYTLCSVGGTKGGTAGDRWGGWGGITWGEMPDIGDMWISVYMHIKIIPSRKYLNFHIIWVGNLWAIYIHFSI